MVNRIRTFATVASLSVLLWVWADGQLRAPDELDLTVQVKSPGRPAVPTAFTVHVRIEGPQKSVTELRAAVEGGTLPLTYLVPVEAGPHEAGDASSGSPSQLANSDSAEGRDRHTVRVLEWLRSQAVFRDAGISVLFCNPQTVELGLEREYELPVSVRDPQGRPLDGLLLKVSPPTVKARMLARTWQTMRERLAVAVLDRALLTGPDGRPAEVVVPLVGWPEVRLEPAEVRVSAAQPIKTRTLDNLPIHISVADVAYWRDYAPDIDPKTFRTRVTVQGSPDAIDRLKPEDVLAYVLVGKSNTEIPPLDTEILFSLPKGVEVVRSNLPESRSPDPPRITCPLKRRATAVP